MEPEPHPLVSLLAACFWVILWLLSWGRALIAFATITVPRFIYNILSYSLTFTLNFYSLAVIFVLSCMVFAFLFRIRYLNDYEVLREPPLSKPDAKELHPDVHPADVPPTMFHNYLDEFLQAIRVFGFLEKPVFHELARHLQTRRLIAGDSLSLDQDKSFYCVVDGMVQVYAKTGRPADQDSVQWDEEDMNGYQLLNEVGSGGTLSSLFTILSLFTEDVKISWQHAVADADRSQHTKVQDDLGNRRGRNLNTLFRADSDVSNFVLETERTGSRHPGPEESLESPSSSGSTVHVEINHRGSTDQSTVATSPTSWQHMPSSQPQTPRSGTQGATRSVRPTLERNNTAQIPGSVARATEDTTLAVIPAEAFKRLTKKFPKASAHIVQVILTRFSRVTFNAAHKYLGLTSELLRTEKLINDIAFHPLPPSFYEGGGLQKLRSRFDGRTSGQIGESETEGSDVDSVDYFSGSVATDTRSSGAPSAGNKTPKSNFHVLSHQDIAENPIPADNRPPQTPRSGLRTNSHTYVNPGDLHSMAGDVSGPPRPSRGYSTLRVDKLHRRQRSLSSTRLGSVTSQLTSGDFDLRAEVMSCIAKSIGLIQPPLSSSAENESENGHTDQSPALPPFSASSSDAGGGEGQHRSMFNSSFGSLSMLEVGMSGGDDASSTSASGVGSGNQSLLGLDNEVEILFFDAGSALVRAGERNAGLFYVIDGLLDVSMPSDEKPKDKSETIKTSSSPRPPTSSNSRSNPFSSAFQATLAEAPAAKAAKSHKHLFTVKPGGIAGYLASLTGTASYVDIRAKTDAYVGFLPSNALERLLEKRPIVLLTLAKRLISLLSPLVLHIDASLDWVQVSSGKVLWRPGEPSDSFYIVLNGRLRAFLDKEGGGVDIVAEYGQGDTVGELDVITNSERTTTLHAIRDTELARMPLTLFNAISARNPQTTVQLLRKIASGVRSKMSAPSQTLSTARSSELARNNFNLKTVAILPTTRHVPVAIFAKKLHAALEGIGAPTSSLNQASVTQHLGRHAFTRMGKLKVAGWLADLEQRYRIVLYVADSPVNSPWTQTCIRQADYIMVVGMGDDPSLGEYERLLLSIKSTARKELVLLHPDRSVTPGSTREWLKNRTWVHAHIHVELPVTKSMVASRPAVAAVHDPAAVAALKVLKSRVQSGLQRYRRSSATARPRRAEYASDFARLARRLCGKSVGVVLGGGGARGVAHLGALRALEEFRIPIDYVAGTSIGALVGGLYARDVDLLASSGRAKQFSARMSNIWRMLSDVTWPVVAYTTGHEFNRSVYKAFYGLHIEDMWLPFFCNTSNILTSQMEIHETGYAWRYVRASMTLAGLLPPLCDNGNMLVDGGYIDNLPVSTMFSLGASAVVAVDVGGLDDNSPRSFGDTVSGWWILLNRWNPFSSTRSIPAITEIQSRLAYVSSVKTLEEAKVTKGCLYMQMPVHHYGTMQFGKHEEIQEMGYKAAVGMLEAWDKRGLLPSVYADVQDAQGVLRRRRPRGRTLRRNSV